ncbi:PucR family transcriptional regulator [Nocardia coubleae]|uniref:PucR family transcriptional regulator n=1 Tax=Nocardia coubleae TaxID=356147 RepID=A0A846W2N0_9NOCA|nr:PucR family transcriptional regulator [Nocardia coubleae]NKX86878.1 PucR family transcriptional regulator [Nocardia coubleae]
MVNSVDLVAACRTEVAVLTDRLIDQIFTDNPAWTDYSPVTRTDLADGCGRYLTRLLDLLERPTDSADDDVAARIGRRRAEQGVPMEAMLRTFRLGGRIVWELLLDKASDFPPEHIRAAGTALWTAIDSLSSALVTAYRTTELEQLRCDERRRHALLEDLISGRAEGDGAFITRAARDLGLPVRSGYLVVVCDRDNTMQHAPEFALSAVGIRSLWHDRADSTVGVVAVEKHDPTLVLRRISQHVGGRAGASPLVTGLDQVARAHPLALLALHTVPDTATGLVSLDERLPQALLIRSPDLMNMLVTTILGPVLALPDVERTTLLQTLSAWLAHNCSAANAATGLHCHRNTVINRLHRVATLLGRPIEGQRSYVELSLALFALELLDPALVRSR